VNSPNGRFASLNCDSSRRFALPAAVFAVVALLFSPVLVAQTVGTGSIVGIVSDPQQKPLAATVLITNQAKGVGIHVTASAAGLYSSGLIQPGEYAVEIEVKGFKPVRISLAVHVGNVTRADVTMRVGTEKAPVSVPGSTTVNVEQPTVQSLINGDKIEKLPIGGRNVLDLAQLEPGLQMQDGSVFGPGKDGISAISVLNHYGRGED